MKLKDICSFQSGGTPSKSNPAYFNGSIPWITTVSLNGKTIREDAAVEWITEQAISESAAKIVPANSIMVGTRVGVGKTAINAVPMSTSQDVISLIGIDESVWNKGYINKLIQSKSAFLNTQARGATIKGVRIEALAEIIINEISKEEQERIVLIMDSVQKIITNCKRELQAFEELIKARFVEMFGDQESNPFGWKQSTVGETCSLKSGTSLPAKVENEGGPIPYVKVGDMNYPGNERYITTSTRFVTAKTAGKGIFPVGSILFPKRGGAIGTNKKRMTILPICADLNVMGVTSNGELIAEYLMAYFNMIDLGTLDNGSSVPQINNKDIAPLRICVPPLKIQKQFARFVNQVDKSKAAVQQALDKAKLLFDSLMQQYFV